MVRRLAVVAVLLVALPARAQDEFSSSGDNTRWHYAFRQSVGNIELLACDAPVPAGDEDLAGGCAAGGDTGGSGAGCAILLLGALLVTGARRARRRR